MENGALAPVYARRALIILPSYMCSVRVGQR